MAETNLDLTDELLVAYVDDELDEAQREMVRSVLAVNPALRRRADEMRLVRSLLSEAFPLQPEASVPEPIEAATNRLAEACAHRASPQAQRARPTRHWRKYALAAGILLCVAASATFLALRSADPVTALMQIAPGTPLYRVLESTASAEVIHVPAESAALRAVLTFRAKDGRFCREFEILAPGRGTTGIACRDPGGEWRAEVLINTPATASAHQGYTPAGDADDPAVAQTVARLMQGDALGTEEETRLLKNKWEAADHP